MVVCGQHALPHGPGTWIDVVVAHRIHDPADVVRRYLAELLGLVEGWDDFAALAHIDYAMRYWPRDRAVCPSADFEEEYRSVLRAMTGRDRTLEINTQLTLEPDLHQR